MIRRSLTMAALAAGTSALAHVGGLSTLWTEDRVLIEGGAEATVARLGDSFRDVAVGQLTPDSVNETVEDLESQAELQPVEPDALLQEIEVSETPPAARSPLPDAAPAEMTKSMETARSTPQARPTTKVPRTTPADQLKRAQPKQTPVETTPLETAMPAAPRSALSPTTAMAPQVLAALPQENEAAPSLSGRPNLRPKAIEEAAAKRQPKPTPTPRAQAPAKPKAEAPPRGNGQTAERRGTLEGQQQAKAQTAASNPGRKAQAAGNATASNYAGIVMRRIARRKPRTSLRGTAMVSFTIAPNGGLAALSLAQSSGSAKLDQLALSAVRRAAPFPRPPSGARTRFSLPVKGL